MSGKDAEDLAKDVLLGKKVNVNDQRGIDKMIMRWDGSSAYYLSQGEWGFIRLTVEIDSGYIDYEIHDGYA